MFIIVGPDGSGKSTLAQKLSEQSAAPVYHHDMNTKYSEYLDELKWATVIHNMIMDRFIWCEYPYASVLKREFGYTPKQYQNITSFALTFNPVVFLCTYKPSESEYHDSYLPYELWDWCISLYKKQLDSLKIDFFEYNYSLHSGMIPAFVRLEQACQETVKWWSSYYLEDNFPIGNISKPKILIVAERLGPNNVHYLPFETGPTGLMLTKLFTGVPIPLGQVAITNIVKAPLKSPRPVSTQDLEILQHELIHIQPKAVVFMGTPARKGIPVANNLGIKSYSVVHLGYYNHRGVTDLTGYYDEWRRILMDIDSSTYRLPEPKKPDVARLVGGNDGL